MTRNDSRSSATIRALRALTIAAIGLPAVILSGIAWHDRQAIEQQTHSDGLTLIAVFHEQAASLFRGHNIILDLVASRMAGRDWDTLGSGSSVLDELEVVDKKLDDASAIVIVDENGRTRATTIPVPPGQPMPAGDPACFDALKSGKVSICITDSTFDPPSGQRLFSLTRRLEKNGAFHGMAQVAISADYIMGLWAAALPHANDTVSIVRSDGTIVAHGITTTAAESPVFGKSISRDIEGLEAGVIQAGIGGSEPRTLVFRRISDYPASIIVGLDRQGILADWYRDLTIYGLIALAAAMVTVMALRVALNRAHKERLAVARLRTEMQERESAQEQLRQSQKMESLGKLTGGIAHDFNNLLTVIVGNVSMVERAIRTPGHKRQLRSALKAGESAVELTQRLLTFARKQILQPQSVNLLRVLQGMEGLLVRTIGPDVRLVIDSDDELSPVLIDPNQMELVILNLAINARDAMPGGGTLRITVRNRQGVVGALPGIADGDYAVLTVADTGTGMDAATLARATEPFFTTKDPGKGTGLGLSMMQSVVAQSGGTSRLSSRLGVGTEVEIWLPRTEAPASLPRSPTGMAVSLPKGETILVCDDDPDVLEFQCDALNDYGFRTIAVESGRAAMAALSENDDIRLLVVDYAMPMMNGGAVVREVWDRYPDLPVLLVTGNAEPEKIQADYPNLAILCKPFDDVQFAARVCELLREASISA